MSTVFNNDTPLGEIISSSLAIVTVKRDQEKKSSFEKQASYKTPEIFIIEKVLLNSAPKSELKNGTRIKVYDANEALYESMGAMIKKRGYNDPKNPIPSPIIKRYNSSLNTIEYQSENDLILFLTSRDKTSSNFRFVEEGAYESVEKIELVKFELKKINKDKK